MSSIQEVGQNLEQVVEHAHDSAFDLDRARLRIVDAQGIVMGVAAESEDPQLHEAVSQYARAADSLTEAVGCLAMISQHISSMGNTIGYEIPPFEAYQRPEVHTIEVPEPIPATGDRGKATPKQLREYTQLEERIHGLLSEDGNAYTIKGYLATGGICYVFRTPDRRIMKVPISKRDSTEHYPLQPKGTMWHSYAKALKQGQGQAGLEQFVAYVDNKGMPERGAVVCEMAPGKTLEETSVEEMDAIPEVHFRRLMQTFRAMEDRRLVHDCDARLTNIMYHPKKGFTIIDYWALDEWRRSVITPDSPPTKASDMAAELISYIKLDVFNQRYLAAYRQAFGEAATQKLHKMLET